PSTLLPYTTLFRSLRSFQVTLGVPGGDHPQGEYQDENPDKIRLAAHDTCSPFRPTPDLKHSGHETESIIIIVLEHFKTLTDTLYPIQRKKSTDKPPTG